MSLALTYQHLPVPQKTWQFDVNQIIEAESNGSLQAAAFFVAYKDSLVGFGSSPWIVRGSSDGSTGTLDSVDRLTNSGSILAAAGAHSWICIRQPATGAEVVYDFNASNAYNYAVAFSPSAGFTGGSTTARPTATDEIAQANAGWFMGNNNGRLRLHVFHTTDGEQTMQFGLYQGVLINMSWIGKAGNAVSGWTDPYYFMRTATGDTTSTLLQQTTRLYTNNGSSNRIKANGPSGSMPMCVSLEGCHEPVFGNGPLCDIMGYEPNTAQGNIWPIQEMGLVSYTTGMKGRHGTLVDVWRTSTGIPHGTVFRSGSVELAAFGAWVVPWSASLDPPIPM